jgi:hypothetical protein
MRRWLIGGLVLSLVTCCILPACIKILFPLDFLVNITFGWFIHFLRLLGEFHPSAKSFIGVAVGAAIVAGVVHLLLRRIAARVSPGDETSSANWPAARTGAVLGILLLMTIAGISALAITNQTIVIVTSREPFAEGFREASPFQKTQNEMKMMGLAMHNFASATNVLPTAATWDKSMERPLLSWRVSILPYIKEQALYGEFHWDEPWDSPHNLRLLPRMPAIYAGHVENDPTKPFHTHFRVFTGKDTAFDGKLGLKLGLDFPEGNENTIMIVEATEAVPWTKPDELIYDPAEPLPALGFRSQKYFLVEMVDGRAIAIDRNVPEADIRGWITRHGKRKPLPNN